MISDAEADKIAAEIASREIPSEVAQRPTRTTYKIRGIFEDWPASFDSLTPPEQEHIEKAAVRDVMATGLRQSDAHRVVDADRALVNATYARLRDGYNAGAADRRAERDNSAYADELVAAFR